MSEQTLAVPANWESTTVKLPSLSTLRIATQVRELALQGVTLRNTLKEMNEVWLSLYTTDKQCPIVEQMGTKVKYQLVNLYAVKLIRYLNSIIGLDLVPLAQQDVTTRTWRQDAIILNISGQKITDHEHLFELMLVNLFGLSQDILKFALSSKAADLREYVKKTYDIDLGEPTTEEQTITLEQVEMALTAFLLDSEHGYHPY
ncbi:hypothetical protein PQD71_gp223 [Kosakonia phage Kc263]|uniref:Uncharacterized protein n=1 Tax=Kosakonia phage Kc263 TaxID=2863194 RepID=A0AAE7WFD8_9CAUD|nr:hypothetical protein PQD71_gp223 [Kosakonia phage Kc263]QYN80103.1 hypothetical protein [Kosakonia phage Kc263]